MQLGQNQEDEDLILYMMFKDRLHDACIDIFLTATDCYLQMAPAEIQEVFHNQTTAMSNGLNTNDEYTLGRPRKRKASEIENGVQVLRIANADDNVEGQVHESGKRSHREITHWQANHSLGITPRCPLRHYLQLARRRTWTAS